MMENNNKKVLISLLIVLTMQIFSSCGSVTSEYSEVFPEHSEKIDDMSLTNLGYFHDDAQTELNSNIESSQQSEELMFGVIPQFQWEFGGDASNLESPQGNCQAGIRETSESGNWADVPWGDYPGPTNYSSIGYPYPVCIYPQVENQINFLLLGLDASFHTDVIMMGVVNLDSLEVNLVSIPRDLYVYIPGYGMDRINNALARGGEDILRMTFEYNFGIIIDNYMVFNFNGFKNFIDTLGGIDLYVTEYVTNITPTRGDFEVYPGWNHLDGENALLYARVRTYNNDFDRNRRQQDVIFAVIDRLLRLEMITSIPELYEQFQETIITDLTLLEIIQFSFYIPDLSENYDLSTYAIGLDQVIMWTKPISGASVLLPKYEEIQSIIKQVINYDD